MSRAATPAWQYLPSRLKRLGRTILFGNRVARHPALTGKGVVEDLYYWVADGGLDTLLPIQNYFSVLFPDRATATSGTIHLNDAQGATLATHRFELREDGMATLRVSRLLCDHHVPAPPPIGTLRCEVRIPADVLDALASEASFYFWDRFYIGYVSADGQPCFVHGVDKTFIAPVGAACDLFYSAGRPYRWVPEIPVDMRRYRRLSLIMINRTTTTTDVRLTVTDDRQVERQWEARIGGLGVHRFELDAASTAGLAPEAMRLRVDGMPTRWGRPVLFAEFPNGAISALHC